MNRYDFQVLDHTADVGLVARGKDLAEAFAAAGYGLSSLLVDLIDAQAAETRRVLAEAEEPEGLLVAWLSELLYLFDAEGFLPLEFRMEEVTGRRCDALVRGDRFDPERHPPHFLVKAVTYHGLSVQCNESGCEVQVILDV